MNTQSGTTATEVLIPEIMKPIPKRKAGTLPVKRAVKSEIVMETRWGIRFFLRGPDDKAWREEITHLDKWSRPNPHDNGLRRLVDADGAARIMGSMENAMYIHGRYLIRRPDGTSLLVTPAVFVGAETFTHQAPMED